MDPLILTAILLGIVEGLTEYLPVSSTGHLIIASELLGYNATRWELFNIAIQPGAIMAIVVLYWRTFLDVLKGLFVGAPSAIAFTRNVLIAFAPAVIVGLALHDEIEAMLGNATIVAVALIVGGIAILLVERVTKPVAENPGGVASVGWKQAAMVGAVQCLAMIPGVSRSGATIMGAVSMGIDRKTAAEFSFFLALPTLVGATVLQLAKHGGEIQRSEFGLIAIGFVVSFVVALAIVKWFVGVVTRYGFAPFAWYRIIVGVATLVWLTLR